MFFGRFELMQRFCRVVYKYILGTSFLNDLKCFDIVVYILPSGMGNNSPEQHLCASNMVI